MLESAMGVSREHPCWIPDWANESEKRGVILGVHAPTEFEDINPFFARYTASGRSSPCFTVLQNQKALLMNAIELDAIEELSSPYDSLVSDSSYVRVDS